jgi:hypothetical protein
VTPDEVRRIAAIRSPVLRNLEITHAYSRLAADIAARGGGAGANWCTFATWASRQAGATIRGEDTIDRLTDRLGGGSLLHPARTFGRWLLRRGLFDASSRLGAVMKRFHTPFDAVELASDAVARGNLKVFEEIALVFAQWLEGERSISEPLLVSAFEGYESGRLLYANLCIGLHEQTRLQPEICEALDAPYVTAEELGRMLSGTSRPLLAKAVGTLALPIQRPLANLAREAITHSLMILALPERRLFLGANLPDPAPFPADAAELVARFEPAGVDDCGAKDWSSLDERMHYISHLFRAFVSDASLTSAPFTPSQVESFRAGVIPEGEL